MGDTNATRLLILGGSVIVALAASIAVGPGGAGLPADAAARAIVLWEIRLPRALLALIVGAGLGIAGAALQSYLKNPLAEPSVLGISGGAAVGGVLAIHTGLASAFGLALPLAGLAGAALATIGIAMLAGSRSGPMPFLLAGVAVAAVCGALVSLVLNLSRNPFAASESIFWMMGSFSDRSRTHLMLASPLIVLGVAVLWRLRAAFDAMTLGDDVAQTLGHEPGRVRGQVVAGVALAVGAATAVTGIIGFVGLIVPHLVRGYLGARPSIVVAGSALGGAILVLAADVAVRIMAPYADIRVGVLTATLGAPFFLWLVLRLRRGDAS